MLRCIKYVWQHQHALTCVQAFGEKPLGADAQLDPMVPNSGVILIGESADKSTESANTSPQLQLPSGRKWGFEYEYAILIDGNVLSSEA